MRSRYCEIHGRRLVQWLLNRSAYCSFYCKSNIYVVRVYKKMEILVLCFLTNKNLSVFYIANMLLDDKELKKNIRNIRNRYKKIKT